MIELLNFLPLPKKESVNTTSNILQNNKTVIAITVPSKLEFKDSEYTLDEIKKDITVEEYSRILKHLERNDPRQFKYRGSLLTIAQIKHIYQYFKQL